MSLTPRKIVKMMEAPQSKVIFEAPPAGEWSKIPFSRSEIQAGVDWLGDCLTPRKRGQAYQSIRKARDVFKPFLGGLIEPGDNIRTPEQHRRKVESLAASMQVNKKFTHDKDEQSFSPEETEDPELMAVRDMVIRIINDRRYKISKKEYTRMSANDNRALLDGEVKQSRDKVFKEYRKLDEYEHETTI